MDKATVRENATEMLRYYEHAAREKQAHTQRLLLEWMNSDEVHTVYRYVCDGHPLDGCYFAQREDIQDWIDECLDDCPGCECGHIEETSMTGRAFGDLFMVEA